MADYDKDQLMQDILNSLSANGNAQYDGYNPQYAGRQSAPTPTPASENSTPMPEASPTPIPEPGDDSSPLSLPGLDAVTPGISKSEEDIARANHIRALQKSEEAKAQAIALHAAVLSEQFNKLRELSSPDTLSFSGQGDEITGPDGTPFKESNGSFTKTHTQDESTRTIDRLVRSGLSQSQAESVAKMDAAARQPNTITEKHKNTADGQIVTKTQSGNPEAVSESSRLLQNFIDSNQKNIRLNNPKATIDAILKDAQNSKNPQQALSLVRSRLRNLNLDDKTIEALLASIIKKPS